MTNPTLSRAALAICCTIAIIFAGCTHEPTVPFRSVASGPSREITDGSHSGGNAHFYWLPPIVGNTKSNGDFDPSLAPLVEICVLDSGACSGPLIASFGTTSGTGGQTIQISASLYAVNWNTKSFSLDLTTTYRIRVKLQGVELGHTDVALAANGSAAKNLDTGDQIVLVDGQTLPIKFRIEKGIAIIPAAGGTASLFGGAVTLSFPPGAVPNDIAITATPVVPKSPDAPDASVIGGTQYVFGPSPISFSAPVTLTLTFPGALPTGVKASRLSICHMANGACRPIGGSVNVTSHTVTATVNSFSSYGVTPFPEMCYGEPGVGYFSHTAAGDFSLPTCGGDRASIRTASWSPDGSQLVYCWIRCWGSGDPGTGSLRVVNADGSGDHALITGGMLAPSGVAFDVFSCPLYSNDGASILFGWNGGIGLMNSNGTNIRAFSSPTPGCAQMLSPNGQTIMMIPGPNEGNIASMNVDGTNQHLLLSTAASTTLIGWSADGTKFAFFTAWVGTGAPGNSPGIYVMNADGSGVVRVAPIASEGQWSPIPGDNRIAYTLHSFDYNCYCIPPGSAPSGIHIVDATGANDHLVIAGESAGPPGWSPDAMRLAVPWCYGPIVLDNSSNPCSVYLINPDGSGLQFMRDSTHATIDPLWRP